MRIPRLVPVAATPSDRTPILKGKIWIARLRTDRVATFRTNASRISNAVAEIPAAIALGVEDLAAVIALVEEEASAGVIVLAVVAVVALAALAVVADSGADAEN